MSLRERQTAKRRNIMLDAAEKLIRQNGGTDFSMRALASSAEVSPTTPYNFFGTKENLLFELLTRHLDFFLQEALIFSTEDPLERVLQAGENVVSIFLRDPIVLRPLYLVVLGVTDPLHHPKFLKDAFVFYKKTLDTAIEKKLLIDEQERTILASSLMAHFMGVLDLWIHEDIADDWFRAQVVYGFIHMLWPIAKGKSLKILQKKYTEVQKTLSDRSLYPPFFGHGVS